MGEEIFGNNNENFQPESGNIKKKNTNQNDRGGDISNQEAQESKETMLERLAQKEGVSVEELKERINKIKERWYGLGKKDLERWYDVMVQKAKELEEKYPQARKFLTFHLFIGSTPPEESILYFDFPGEDSIEKFVQEFSF